MIVDIALILKVEIEDGMLIIVQNTTRIEEDNMVPILKIHIQWEGIYDTSGIMYELSHDLTMLLVSIINNIGQINSSIDQGLEKERVEISIIIIGVSQKNHEDLELHPTEGKKVGVEMNIDHGRDITNQGIDHQMYDNNTIKRMKRRRKGGREKSRGCRFCQCGCSPCSGHANVWRASEIAHAYKTNAKFTS